MMTLVGWLVSPIGRWLAGAGLVVLLFGGVYAKGYSDGRTAYKAKIEREIRNAIQKGDAARERALREFDASPDSLPDDGFRRP